MPGGPSRCSSGVCDCHAVCARLCIAIRGSHCFELDRLRKRNPERHVCTVSVDGLLTANCDELPVMAMSDDYDHRLCRNDEESFDHGFIWTDRRLHLSHH